MRRRMSIAVCLVPISLFDASVFSWLVSADDKAMTQVQFSSVNVFDGKADKLATNRRVLVEGNPVENVSVRGDYQNNIDLIMTDGVIYKSTLLADAISPELR